MLSAITEVPRSRAMAHAMRTRGSTVLGLESATRTGSLIGSIVLSSSRDLAPVSSLSLLLAYSRNTTSPSAIHPAVTYHAIALSRNRYPARKIKQRLDRIGSTGLNGTRKPRLAFGL